MPLRTCRNTASPTGSAEEPEIYGFRPCRLVWHWRRCLADPVLKVLDVAALTLLRYSLCMAAMRILLAALAMAHPAAGASPFEGLYRLEGVTTSNDEFGIWLSWVPSSYRLEFPGRPPLAREQGSEPELFVALEFGCRADGRAEGYRGAAPLWAALVLPLHPDEPDVPNWIDPRYWLLGLTGPSSNGRPFASA